MPKDVSWFGVVLKIIKRKRAPRRSPKAYGAFFQLNAFPPLAPEPPRLDGRFFDNLPRHLGAFALEVLLEHLDAHAQLFGYSLIFHPRIVHPLPLSSGTRWGPVKNLSASDTSGYKTADGAKTKKERSP